MTNANPIRELGWFIGGLMKFAGVLLLWVFIAAVALAILGKIF